MRFALPSIQKVENLKEQQFMSIINPGRRFKKAIQSGPLLLPGIYDALTALLVEKTGYKAAYVSGAGLSVSMLGKPDIGLITLAELTDQVRRLSSSVDIPLLVDADTGFGGEWNVQRTVQDLEAAGAAGIQIEDQLFPKRCGHLEGKSLIPKEEMVAKIRRAILSRKSKDFVIVARTDARGVSGMADALKRAEAYKKAGADIVFPEALQTIEEFQAFGKKKLGTLMANMTEFGLSPALTVSQCSELGYRVILFPMTAFRVAAFSIEQALQRLRKEGTSRSFVNQMQTRRELYKLNHYDKFNQSVRKNK